MWFLPFLKLGSPFLSKGSEPLPFPPFFSISGRISVPNSARSLLGWSLVFHWYQGCKPQEEDDSFGKRFKHGGCDSLDLCGSHGGFLEPPQNGCLSTSIGPTKRCTSGGPNKKAIETSCRSSTVSGALSGCYPTILIAVSSEEMVSYPTSIRRGATSFGENVEVSIHFLWWIPCIYIYIL